MSNRKLMGLNFFLFFFVYETWTKEQGMKMETEEREGEGERKKESALSRVSRPNKVGHERRRRRRGSWLRRNTRDGL